MKSLVVIALLFTQQIVAGPTQCYSCLENDSATCSANQQVQTCATDRGSLGTTHCGFGAGIYRDALGNTNYGVMRGCINCADKRQACERTFGYLKALRGWTLQQCEIECCTGDKCNSGIVPTLPTPGSVLPTPAGPTQCYSCLENDPATCSANQRVQTCATDLTSLGTTHCGSGAGIYRNESGNINHGVFRGCINCADKAQACGRVFGYVKAFLGWTVQQCEIECCTGDKCNTGTFPTVPTSGSGGGINTQEQVTGMLAFAAAYVIIWHHF